MNSDAINVSPVKRDDETSSATTMQLSTPTPTKFKNLTQTDIEKLSDEDCFELAMRQSMKENSVARRAIDMSPIGMSEEDQVHLNISHIIGASAGVAQG